MRRNDHMARRFLAVFLASVLAYGNFGIQVALGVEATGGNVDVTAQTQSSVEKSEPAETEGAATDDLTDEAADTAAEPTTQTSDDTAAENPVATTSTDSNDDASATTSDDSGDSDTVTAAEDQLPYSIEVTFGGQKLSDKDGENNFTDANYWTSTAESDAKMATVTLVRNKGVKVDQNKKYVLALSLPTVLNFGGIPSVDKLPTGTSAVALKRNSTFLINAPNYARYNYNLSAYSGEMRFELNTAVDRVDVTDLYVYFDPILVGYKTNGSTIKDAFSARVVAVDGGKDLATYDASEDATEVIGRKVDSLVIKNSYSVTDNMSYYSSNNGFVTAVSGDAVNAAADGSLSYSLRTGSMTPQVYSSMKLTFEQPYVLANGERRYLDFDENEEILTTNRASCQSGWRTASKATYDEKTHLITYYLKDVLTASWCPFVISPKFTLPDDLKASVPDSGYEVITDGWRVVEQKTYLGDDSTQMPAWRTAPSCKFVQSSVDIKLGSSDSPLKAGTARRKIYKDVCSGSGLTATLGLFDVHNEGVSDSCEVNVEFKFNTNQTSSSAIYKATRLNVPLYEMGDSAEVTYKITNGTDTETGTKTITRSDAAEATGDKLYIYASHLSGGKSGYYFEELSYTTKLRNSTMFHTSVTHGGRNYVTDPGVFTGYMDGEVNQTAEATMTITSKDGSAITKDGKSSVTVTEKSTISDDNSTSFGTYQTYLNSGQSALITAGEDAKLSLTLSVTSEEYPIPGVSPTTVNGYHVVENPAVYICLPEGVSIKGIDQAYATMAGKTINSTKVYELDKSGCTVDGRKAKWWVVEFDGANVTSNFVPKITLSTNNSMEGVAWNFSNKVVTRSKGQKVTWALASAYNNFYNNVSSLQNNSQATLSSLGAALASSDDASAVDRLGAVVYRTDTAAMLNIVRAEAKLNVKTSLSLDDGAQNQKSLKVTNSGSEINYDVTVASDDGGHADDFNYYIPVPKTTSGDDSNMFVSQRDFSLALDHAVEIVATDSDGKAIASGGDVFKVQYTTQEGLTSDEARKDSVVWQDSVDDLSKVTAVRISTVDGAMINDGSSYKFHLTFKYQGDDFDTQAGRSVQWRSFGHYSYQRGTATPTTNSYPSQDNSVKLGFIGDYTDASTRINVTLDTASANNYVLSGSELGPVFKNAQTMAIKSVSTVNGTKLVSSDPASLTGADANVSFMMQMGIGSGSGMTTLATATKGGSFNVNAGSATKVSLKALFSKALTDSNTDRYVDVRFGNDDVDMTVRMWLTRKVAEVAVTGSGTAAGEVFKAAAVDTTSKAIASNAAFTALFDVKNFRPGNFTKQKLVWKSGVGGLAASLPAGTKITMMVLGAGEGSPVESWWLYTATGSETEIDLKSFKRMDGASDAFSYDTSSSDAAELKYQFVVSLPANCTTTGNFALALSADPKSGVAAFATDDMPIVLAAPAGFGLSVGADKVDYSYTASEGSDSRTTGKQLALVLKPASDGDVLPADARLSAGDKTYARNADGAYVVPLGSVASGSVDLSVVSDMLGMDGGTYKFDVSLMLYGGEASAPMAGDVVETAAGLELKVAASDKPALKVTGTRVATKAKWIDGQTFDLAMSGVTSDMTVTVSAYSGLTSSQPATDLMSSVGGVFVINGGSGTYDAGRTATGMLRLGNNAKAGTYRLVFEAKRGDDVLLTVPYYIVVRE